MNSRFRYTTCHLVALGCAMLISLTSTLSAGTLYGVGPGAPTGPFVADASTNNAILIGSLDNPVSITIDPTGPAWGKDFTFNRDGQGWFPGQTVQVHEVIQFVPSTSSAQPADWHETIDPTSGDGGNFVWGTGTLTVLSGTGSFSSSLSTDGRSIWFYFPTLPIPSEISITKTLVWTGGVITPSPNGENNYHIHVDERPSPEPSTLALAFLGIATLLVWKRRQ